MPLHLDFGMVITKARFVYYNSNITIYPRQISNQSQNNSPTARVKFQYPNPYIHHDSRLDLVYNEKPEHLALFLVSYTHRVARNKTRRLAQSASEASSHTSRMSICVNRLAHATTKLELHTADTQRKREEEEEGRPLCSLAARRARSISRRLRGSQRRVTPV